jgi:hypothetical protein
MFKDWGECVKDGVATISCVPVIFLNLLNALFAFAGLMAITMFIMGSYKFINSAGDQKKIESAKNNFSYGLLGLVIVAFSFTIIRIISTVTNVPCITTFGFGC